MKEKVLEKFLRYISIDTASDPESESQPSTSKQLDLSRLLVKELREMGINNAELDEWGYVMATIPSNLPEGEDVPAIGFIAHVDSAPDASGANIKPQIIKSYDGSDIIINKELGFVMKVDDFPELLKYKGQTLITTDGTTLLAADDKAGVAEIMTAAEYIMTHPEFSHGTIKIGFTPDEEIGRGVDKFDVEKFGAEFAYTLDGGEIGELEYENFNAASAKIFIQGRNIHPGYAKDKMINAIILGTELNAMLPVDQRPEYTTEYEGFFHIIRFDGTVEKANIQYIIRDHDFDKFESKKVLISQCVDFLNKKYGEGTFSLELKDQYYNMRKQVEPHYHIIEKAVKAMEMAGIKPKIKPIRGGTDGARLSFMGLPCPNIFAGGHNFHGKFEYIPAESMEKATEVIINLVSLYSKENKK
ncbi:Peptidase T [bioreactor metagenome]|uniref:Peptidase T n=1 Tax=bioreactor metagenome TaxID=1076179 RepID=A0A644W7M4_9ZZZZ|nr:peptidase T [Bacteroidales bacterium]MBP6453750.1 peptidase T [Bacteroidales bacterium]MBP8677823.1 peptidase T [Bacteroidales bacterium]MBP9584984.1 peptidase T [Bacteroidales bacterium]MBP9978528.1 peptidase T [Bacteroidales bacterium]